MQRKRSKIILAAIIVLLAGLFAVAVQVEDWSRDLTTNHITTSPDAADPLLRTLLLPASPAEVRQIVFGFAERTPRWVDCSDRTSDDGHLEVLLVHTTRFLRFADDVVVTIGETDNGTRVKVVSQSRVGKGDLGQNARNIRQLTTALHEYFDANR